MTQYHLPACLRFLEAAHIPELLRDAGPAGVRASRIAERTGVDETKIGASAFAPVFSLLFSFFFARPYGTAAAKSGEGGFSTVVRIDLYCFSFPRCL